jgi:hypothetical protein
MKKALLTIGILVFCSLYAFSQPKAASSVTAGSVTVYSDNGYYIKAKNSDSKAWTFSFKYETTGYTVSTAAWSKYPVYTPVNTITEEYKNVTIQANEQRDLFTAPVANDKATEYYIKVIEVYDAKPVE